MKNDDKREHWTYRVSGIEPGDAVILDIDGVLADASGRQHHLTRNDWRSFFEDVNEDPVIAEVGVMAQLLDSSLQIILVTGRPHRVSAKTVASSTSPPVPLQPTAWLAATSSSLPGTQIVAEAAT